MKSSKQLDSFIAYCKQNPEQRFWQALTNWSGYPFIGWAEDFTGKSFRDLWHEEG